MAETARIKKKKSLYRPLLAGSRNDKEEGHWFCNLIAFDHCFYLFIYLLSFSVDCITI